MDRPDGPGVFEKMFKLAKNDLSADFVKFKVFAGKDFSQKLNSNQRVSDIYPITW